MIFSRLFEKMHRLLASKPHVGGLEISNSSLKYLAIKGGRSIQQASLKLPPGIIQQGKSANTEQLSAAFKNLHNQIAPLTTPLSIVLIIPSSLVYAQSFSVPMMPAKEQEEAIDLNLQMISPGKIEESYYDWQEIKKNESAGHVDLLGAFTNSRIVDEYISALTSANFNVASVEFPGLSLSRLVKERWQDPAANQHKLLIYINHEGLLVTILKDMNLYFSHFTPWTDIVSTSEEREIAFGDIQTFITQEIQRVLAFYLGRTGQSLTNALLISPMFNYEIVQMTEQKFSLTMKNLTITELPELSPSWFPVLGAALRGLIPRSKDTFLSLSQISAKTEYYQERALSLIALCRNIVVGSLIFVFVSYLTVDGIFYRSEVNHEQQSSILTVAIDTVVVQKLREEAEAFNQLTTLANIANSSEANWSPVFDAIRESTGTSITLTRIFADRNNLSLMITGTATNELAALNFKGRVERIANIKNVSLPLNQIKTEEVNAVSFSLTATLSSL
ncbi:MAG: hypothetical protein Q7R62_03555 [bacterium]|nr:hypothetical protein [bacterium]